MTIQELINASGRMIGELRSGRAFNSLESADALVTLNQMVSEWSAALSGIYQATRETLLSTGAVSYTFGPAGDLGTARPVRVTAAATLAASGRQEPTQITTSPAEFVQVVTDNSMTSDFAEILLVEYGTSQATLRPWPKVNSGSTLVLWSLKPLTAFAALSDSVTLPPGYEEALISNLAIRLAPEFNRTASQELVTTAQRSYAALAGLNAELLGSPAAVPAPPEASA